MFLTRFWAYWLFGKEETRYDIQGLALRTRGKGVGTEGLGARTWLNWLSIILATLPLVNAVCLLLLFNKADLLFIPGETVGEDGR